MLDMAALFDFAFADDHSLLLAEAGTLFEQSLAAGDDTLLRTFVEQQLAAAPPRLGLLRHIAADLEQRLLALRGAGDDVRDQVTALLRDGYGVDISPLIAMAQTGEWYDLTGDDVVTYAARTQTLAEDDRALLVPLVEAALHMAAQLHTDIEVTARLAYLVADWLRGLHAAAAREQWHGALAEPPAPHAVQH